MTAEDYMRRAIELAKRGEGTVSPNPPVGCVVVKDGRIIAEGWHERAGEFHAERNALTHCSEDPSGADLYVTLEPCCHYGRTPPCTEIIIEKKIKRVFVGVMDCNPLVAGKGVQILRDAGIEVHTGILENECRRLVEIFFHYMQTKKPFIALKYAMSLDGKIACASGSSRWITGAEAREDVHALRNRYSGIMAGIGTVLADDPLLNCRLPGGHDPVRIIADSNLRLSVDSQIAKTARQIPTIAVCTERAAASEKSSLLQECSIEVLAAGAGPQADLPLMAELLGQRGIDSILVEGGGTLEGSLFSAGLVNRVYAYVGAKLIGGKGAKSPVEGEGAAAMQYAMTLKDIEVVRFGNDIRISGLKEVC